MGNAHRFRILRYPFQPTKISCNQIETSIESKAGPFQHFLLVEMNDCVFSVYGWLENLKWL